ncbi:MAG: hypothetical protein NDI94_03755 [Candidatus Woesearchaeota archaeon]|nr:hypothetical protein [Candidatus Woesearchaeota archaeon]
MGILTTTVLEKLKVSKLDLAPDSEIAKATKTTLRKMYGWNTRVILERYPAGTLLESDKVLDELCLLETPQEGEKRIDALMNVVDLSRGLNIRSTVTDSPIGAMSRYWNKVPLFYPDFGPFLLTMLDIYNGEPRLHKTWDFIQLRDGVLDVVGELIQKYGIEAEANRPIKAHTMGVMHHNQRYLLNDVTPLELGYVLFGLNKTIASECKWPYHIESTRIRGNQTDWKMALYHAAESTIKHNQTMR